MIETVNPIRYYDDNAELFATQASDETANQFEYRKNMPSLIAICNGMSGNFLDFGCGAGNFTAMLSRKDRMVEGCDPSINLLTIARNNHPEINFVNCTSNGQVETDKEYALVIAKLVFHYITNLSTVLDNLTLKLRTGGHLLFSVPHPDKTKAHFDTDIQEGTYIDEVGNFGITLTMVHRSLARLETILAASKLDIVEAVTIYDEKKPKRLNILAVKT